jgi:tetratricopeptide (TPR) repeat protein
LFLLGTLKYMAPEQCLDAHSADESADVYSLGAIGYELLCGSPPFRAASSWELIERHLREPPPPLPERGAADDVALPAVLRALILEMLSKSPLSRPAMAQVAERLQGLRPDDSQGPRSQPAISSPLRSLSRRERGQRRLVLRIVFALTALLVLGSMGGLGYYASKQRRSAVRQRQQTLATTAEILTIIRRTLRPMPGAQVASQGLLDLTGRQLTTLFEQLPDDLEVGEALVRLHSLRGDFARHHGSLSNAKTEYEAAIVGAQQLVRARPGERQYQLLLANAHDGLGDALEQVADLQQARAQYEKALSIRRELLRVAPADSLPAQEVVGSHLLLGDLAQAQGRQQSALSAYEQAMALLMPLWKREPDNKGYRWQMCGIHYRTAQTLLQLGRSLDALAMAERAVEMLTRIAPTDQQGSSYHVLYSRVLQVRGLAREHLGRADEAAADLRQSHDEVSALLKAPPTMFRPSGR